MRMLISVCVITLAAAVLGGCVITPAGYEEPAYDESAQPVDYGGAVDEVREPPPPLPDYDQPPCPVEGYIWTPGVWKWGPEGYYWVPGTWAEPPALGLLWTPGYWGLSGAIYVFHPGYWGPHVGFYGGINYGHGYLGSGYAGGRWVNNAFQYNRAVTNVNITNIHNTYNQTIVNNVNITNVTNVTRVSYAGGPGTRGAPDAREIAAGGEAHLPQTPMQIHHEALARSTVQLNATRNEGRPPIAATANAGGFTMGGVTPARTVGPAYRPQFQGAAAAVQSGPTGHAHDLPRPEPFAASAPANASQQDYTRQQFDLRARQEQERQALALQQEREHSSFARQPQAARTPQAYQAMEQRHQQQTEDMRQRHQQERR